MRNALIVSALVLGLVAAFPTASPGGGSTYVNVGGIDYNGNQSSASPSSNKIRERSQPVNTSPTSPDLGNRLIDRAHTGSTKSATGTGGSTTRETYGPYQYGTYQGDSGEYSKPGEVGEYGRPTSPSCSTTSITVGDAHRTTLHCPGGTIR